MARSPLLFTWTGFAPSDVRDPRDPHRRKQVSCAIVLPSKAEFMRQFGYPVGYVRDYVNAEPLGRVGLNPVHQAAVAKPGVLFWHDSVRHTPGENVVLEYPGEYRGA